jgi:pimeloyl-ACP methyl ester carboxylesterase/DNA-binding CsgD family transcriptional regulator
MAPTMATATASLVAEPQHQRIRFCRGADGVRLAHASHGHGPPLVVVSCWLSHLQRDWQSPVWRHFLDDLGAITTLIRYDERGFGLSDWEITDFSLEARVADLEAIIEAVDVGRVSLLGMSGGATVAIAYAARHPEKVDRLILYGAAPVWVVDQQHLPEEEVAFRALITAGWAREDPIFRRVFTRMFIPDATQDQMGWFDELQRMSTSTENALASRIARQQIDLSDELPRIAAPTLVLHARDDRVSFEHARMAAAAIPDARLVPLDSGNHILLADEPAWQTFMDEVRSFMAPATMTARAGYGVETLTPREREVLRLASDGWSNAEIAGRLVLSVRTIERHLSNAYLKLGTGGKTARAAAVASLLRGEAG